jgi:hypothetical protein
VIQLENLWTGLDEILYSSYVIGRTLKPYFQFKTIGNANMADEVKLEIDRK